MRTERQARITTLLFCVALYGSLLMWNASDNASVWWAVGGEVSGIGVIICYVRLFTLIQKRGMQ